MSGGRLDLYRAACGAYLSVMASATAADVDTSGEAEAMAAGFLSGESELSRSELRQFFRLMERGAREAAELLEEAQPTGREDSDHGPA